MPLRNPRSKSVLAQVRSSGWFGQRRRAAWVLLVAIGAAACGGSRPPTTDPPEPDGRAAGLAVAEVAAAELAVIASSFRARLIRLETVINACHRDRCVSLEGSLLVARSGALAAHLTGPGGNVEMVSDGRTLEMRLGSSADPEEYDALDLPSGGRSQPYLVLAPLDLADALLPQIVPAANSSLAAPVIERRSGVEALMLVAIDPPRLLRRIVFDPLSHRIRRIERFDDAGSLRLSTTYDGWDPRRGPPSGRLQLSWPQRDAVLDMAIGDVELEPPVDRGAFRLRAP